MVGDKEAKLICACGCGQEMVQRYSHYRPKFIRGHNDKNQASKVVPPAERFWAKVQKTRGCWIWLGGKNRKEYGTFYLRKRVPVGAHRFSYQLAHGLTQIPDGLFVCHECDNPQCVRPDHLFLGTNEQNMQDAKKKGRLQSLFCAKGIHELSGANVRKDIRGRRCRLCDNARARRNHAAKTSTIKANGPTL